MTDEKTNKTREKMLVDGEYKIEHRSSRSLKSKLKNYFKNEKKVLTLLTVSGIVIGFTVGFILNPYNVSESTLLWLGLPGELFMRILKVIILPLIVSSVIVGAASVDPKVNGRICSVALTYIIATNLVGSLFGLVSALIIQPGSWQTIVIQSGQPDTQHLQTEDIFADLIRNLFPDNIVGSTFQKTQTVYRRRGSVVARNISGEFKNSTITDYTRSLTQVPGTNLLGLILLSALLGMAAGNRRDTSEPFIKFFDATEKIISQLFHWALWYTPVGVASLIAHALAKATDMASNFTSLGYFLLALSVGVVVFEFVFLPLMIFIILRTNPFRFHLTAVKAQLTGFVAQSSAVAIPDMFQCVEEKHGVDPKVSRFVVPLAVTLNRDGSALFICTTAVYIAQLTGNTSSGTITMMLILAFVGSLAIPAIPSASIITLLIILSSLNVPPVNIGLLMALEWFTDRLRSTCNSYSCIICAVVTYKFTKQFINNNDPAIPSCVNTTLHVDGEQKSTGEEPL